ncbi:MAG: hypothetical protein ACNI3A_11885 [Desulfovibrio sp.]|uniref:hypothetical protein n=1 Tax=Desulfovibrio sp. 7SRBS1 TaxID=3378064 RepID=UPI003B3E6669
MRQRRYRAFVSSLKRETLAKGLPFLHSASLSSCLIEALPDKVFRHPVYPLWAEDVPVFQKFLSMRAYRDGKKSGLVRLSIVPLYDTLILAIDISCAGFLSDFFEVKSLFSWLYAQSRNAIGKRMSLAIACYMALFFYLQAG